MPKVRKNPPEYKSIGQPRVMTDDGVWIVQDATTFSGATGEIVVAGPFATAAQAKALLPHVKPFHVLNGRLYAGVQSGGFDGSKRQTFAAVKKNPPLVVFGNPGRGRGRILSRRAISIRYVHVTDGQRYEHKFGKDDVIECLPDGTFRIYNARGKRLWKDFR